MQFLQLGFCLGMLFIDTLNDTWIRRIDTVQFDKEIDTTARQGVLYYYYVLGHIPGNFLGNFFLFLCLAPTAYYLIFLIYGDVNTSNPAYIYMDWIIVSLIIISSALFLGKVMPVRTAMLKYVDSLNDKKNDKNHPYGMLPPPDNTIIQYLKKIGDIHLEMSAVLVLALALAVYKFALQFKQKAS